MYNHQWFSPCAGRNRVMLEHWSVDFKIISVPFIWTCSEVLCIAMVFICKVAWDCDAVADIDNSWGEYIILGVKFVYGVSTSIQTPALAYGSCRVSNQDTILHGSRDLQNAQTTILNPVITLLCSAPLRRAVPCCILPMVMWVEKKVGFLISNDGLVITLILTFLCICAYRHKQASRGLC